MSKWLVGVFRILLSIIGIMVLLLCIYWLPDMADLSAKLNPEVAYLKYPILIGIYLTCIPFYLAIFQTFKLLMLIGRDNAFTGDACKSLRIISFSAIGIVILYIIGIVYLIIENAMPPVLFLLGLVIIIATLLIAAFAAILKALLTKVVDIKYENDFTV